MDRFPLVHGSGLWLPFLRGTINYIINHNLVFTGECLTNEVYYDICKRGVRLGVILVKVYFSRTDKKPCNFYYGVFLC